MTDGTLFLVLCVALLVTNTIGLAIASREDGQ